MSPAPTVRAADDLLRRYREVRAATLALAEPLEIEDLCVQSMPDASPTKWHLAHTAWFFETFVLATDPSYRPVHPAYSYLFNSYYQAVGPMHARPRRGLLSRPTVAEVLEYRAIVDARLEERLGAGDLDEALLPVVELGLQHEQQHQELLLTDIKHAFGSNPLLPAYAPRPRARRPAAPLTLLEVEGGLVDIGFVGSGFCFDNERPRHKEFVAPFALASRLVTAGEYLAFIEDDGYRRPELWLSDGWDRVQREGQRAPLYWDMDQEGGPHVFTLAGLEPLDLDAPVCHVSGYEADAYARWAGARLPTEAEWELVASSVPVSGNLLESGALHPLAASDEAGCTQLFGDVWEWTQSAYSPYPGYRAPAGALGEYNGKFMSSQLVLRGGSCATPRSHVRATYRNFFPPASRWQFSGIRLARDP